MDWGLIVQIATLFVVSLYTLATFKLLKTATDSLRVSSLPLLNIEVVNFNPLTNQGICVFKNSELRPAFFWLQVRGFRFRPDQDWMRDTNELQLLRRENDPRGYYDGTRRQFLAPGDSIQGWFTLDELGRALGKGEDVLVEVNLRVTGDDKVTSKDDKRVLAYPPKRWLLKARSPLTQGEVIRIF